MRSARSELLVRLVGEQLFEVHLLAGGEVVLCGSWLSTAPVPMGPSVGVPAEVRPMAECFRSTRPPPVRERETGLAQETVYTVTDDADPPFDDAIRLGAVWHRAEMDGRAEVDFRLRQLLCAVG